MRHAVWRLIVGGASTERSREGMLFRSVLAVPVGVSGPGALRTPPQLAASILSTNASLDFRCFTSPVKDGRFFDIAMACPGRRIFGGVP